MFPPVCNAREKADNEEDTNPIEMSKYNDLNYWGPKLQSIEDVDDQIEIKNYF